MEKDYDSGKKCREKEKVTFEKRVKKYVNGI